MGILNVTPDSFSDGGQFIDPAARHRPCRAHGRRRRRHPRHRRGIHPALWRREAGLGRTRNWRGSTPVLPAVVKLGVPVSIDTIKAEVAAWALDQGAAIVNDVWGLQRDPDMARVVAERGVPVIVMHNRDEADPTIDIVADVNAFFARSLDIAAARRHRARAASCSIPASASARRRSKASSASPGSRDFKRFGLPLLVGASRKRFINTVTPSPPDRAPRRLDRRPSAGGRERRGHRAHA